MANKASAYPEGNSMISMTNTRIRHWNFENSDHKNFGTPISVYQRHHVAGIIRAAACDATKSPQGRRATELLP
jgi:hypothetical protein